MLRDKSKNRAHNCFRMWQPLNILTILLLLTSILDAALVGPRLDCRRLEERVTDADGDDELVSDDVEGASRGVTDGWATDPHAWLGTAWDRNKKDGTFSGNVIHLGNNHILAHKDTSAAIVRPRLASGNLHHIQPTPVLFKNPNKININRLPNSLQGDIFEVTHRDIGGSPFDVHKIEPFNDATTVTKTRGLAGNPKPHLERNVNEFGNDCHGYGWARGVFPGSSRDGLSDKQDKTRHFVRFPVNRKNCDGILCSFAIDRTDSQAAQNCNTKATHGSPILCGPDKKLTYVIAGSAQSSGIECTGIKNFNAYHVPQIINGLKGLF